MTDLVTRSGRCHGPDCHRMITEFDRSPDFCSEECQTHWHRLWTRGTAVTRGWVRPRDSVSRVWVNGADVTAFLAATPTPARLAHDARYCPTGYGCLCDCRACRSSHCGPMEFREVYRLRLDEDRASAPAQPVNQTNRSWSERLTGWWRPNG
jgi:hypothetical protein